jgi:biotin carboxyl carrier protein
MKLELDIGGRRRELDLETDGTRCRFRLDGAAYEADAVPLRRGAYSILMDGRVFDVKVTPAEEGVVVTIDGQRFAVQARDPRRWQPSAAGAPGHGVLVVKAPMPGKVVRVLVQPGDAVEAGDGLVVVEAMKMQNEMKAARPGRVSSVAAKQGDTVAAGQVLLTLE